MKQTTRQDLKSSLTLLFALFLGTLPNATFSQIDPSTPDSAAIMKSGPGEVVDSVFPGTTSFPVIFSGDTLFYVSARLGPYDAQQRATQISKRLQELYSNADIPPDSLRIIDTEATVNIGLDEMVILAVSKDDVESVNLTRQELAHQYLQKIRASFFNREQLDASKSWFLQAGIAVLLLLAAIGFFWIMRKIFPRVYTFVESQEGKLLRPIRIFSQELISAQSLSAFALFLFKLLRLAISLVILYFFLKTTFDLFPLTRKWRVTPILNGLLFTLGVTVVFAILWKAVQGLFEAILSKIPEWKGTVIQAIRFRTIEIVSEERIVEILLTLTRVIRLGSVVVLGYFYIAIVFSFFPLTQTWAADLIGYISAPLKDALMALLNYLPNLFYIGIIVGLAYYVIRAVHFVFGEVTKGTISLPAFHAEWSEPTYKIVRFLLIAFTAVIVFPYLPGSSSPAFQGVSVFLGILFSLGSTSAIANMVAGVVLTYMRPFKIGDRVKIADTMGDVVEKTLLVTRIRTVKNVDITIPNAMVLGSHIINYTSAAKDKGLILHTTVTIGYDVPWKRVHELLLAAAQQVENILPDPPPFILQTSLDDFYVSYELNAYTDNPGVMAKTYSGLHQNIQDKFFEAGVEILSPHYSAVRDGHVAAIPEDYLPKSYSPPSFRVSLLDKLLGKTDTRDLG